MRTFAVCLKMHNKKEKSVFYSLFFFLVQGLTKRNVCLQSNRPPSTFMLAEYGSWYELDLRVFNTFGKSFTYKLLENS